MLQITQAHSGLKLVHLSISANPDHMLLIYNSIIFQAVKPVPHPFLSKNHCPALNAVKYLGCVEAEYTGIPELPHALSHIPFSKGVGRIVNHLKSILFGNGFNALHIADISVDMDRNNPRGLICNKGLQLVHIYGVIHRINIAEYRSQMIAHNGMGGGSKGEWGGYYLPGKLQGLNRHLQSHVSVNKENQLIRTHIISQLFLQPPVEISHISQPCAIPYGLNHLDILLIRGK